MSWIPMTFKTIAFTGDYSQLKNMGFVFQKLYASNYMQWHHEASDIRIWKKGADLTINQIDGMEGQLLKMLLDNQVFQVHKFNCGNSIRMFKNRVTNELTHNGDAYYDEIDKGVVGYLDRMWSPLLMDQDTMLMLQKLGKLGWVHVKEIEGEHHVEDDFVEEVV